MKNLFLVVFCAVALCAVATGLKCHHCFYVESDDENNNEQCVDDFGSLTIDCATQVYNGTLDEVADRKYYCAKFVGTTDDDEEKEVIFRNCYTKQDGTEVTDDDLRGVCNFGKSHIFMDDEDEPTKYDAGELCLCEGELCNSANSIGLHFALLGIGLIVLKHAL